MKQNKIAAVLAFLLSASSVSAQSGLGLDLRAIPNAVWEQEAQAYGMLDEYEFLEELVIDRVVTGQVDPQVLKGLERWVPETRSWSSTPWPTPWPCCPPDAYCPEEIPPCPWPMEVHQRIMDLLEAAGVDVRQ